MTLNINYAKMLRARGREPARIHETGLLMTFDIFSDLDYDDLDDLAVSSDVADFIDDDFGGDSGEDDTSVVSSTTSLSTGVVSIWFVCMSVYRCVCSYICFSVCLSFFLSFFQNWILYPYKPLEPT